MDLFLQPFTLGTGTVVTLPKKWGVTPNVKLKGKKTGRKIALEIVDKQNLLERDLALIDRLAGSFKGKFDLTPQQLKRNYELGTYGKTWK